MTMELLANIDVADLERGIAFYCRMLGLEVTRKLGDSIVELSGASSKIYLIAQPDGSAANATTSQKRDYSRHWTPVHLDFVVPEIEAAVARAREAGATLEVEIRTHKWGRIAVLADPFGNGFCLVQFLGRGYDEIATRPG
jgi:predicted enzyme related to lactoylglutathione lyase